MRVVGRWALWALVAMLVIVASLRATAIRWWRVPEGDPYLEASIAPTLRGGDLLLLWRLSPPALGALVVCPEPKHPERMAIGRMVGEEQTTVVVDGSRLSVDGKVSPTEGACDDSRFKVTAPQGESEIEQSCSMEVVGGLVHQRGNAEAIADVGKLELKLGEGEVALISDNRRFPYDSRDYGAALRETCTETIFFRLFGARGFFDAASRFRYIR